MREYKLTYQKNIRDLGGLVGYEGKKVKYGRIFRGGFLDKVDPSDVPVLDSFKLTDIVDFRGQMEFEHRPDVQLKGVIYHNFPAMYENVSKEHFTNPDGNLIWFVEHESDGHRHMLKVYKELMTSEYGQEAYKNFFKLLLSSDDRVVYFHCSQGKDRAGLAAYLVEIALGVSHEDAKIDYLLSNIAMETKIKHLKNMLKDEPFYNPTYELKLLDVFYAKEDYLNAAIESVIKEYGDFETYLEKVLEVDLNKLRELYLE